LQLVPIVVETLAAACVFAITIACVSVSAQRDEGPAGGAVRVLMTLLLPSLALAFAHQYYWPVSLIVSAVLAAVQMRALPAQPALRIAWNVDVLAIALVVALVAIKGALSVATTPYDIDSIGYHLPMSVEYLQVHTAVPAQVMFHPGNSELLDALGVGAQGGIGGQTLTEAVVAVALWLAAYGIAKELAAPRPAALFAASSVLAIPMIADQLFTAQNDIIVATLLLAFVALWQRAPFLSAMAFGLVVGAKFTGAVEAVVLLPLLWKRRSASLSWRHGALALVVACPWYVRNAIETGNPFFLGGQTSGFASTIGAHAGETASLVFMAIRNYGGLLALVGIIAITLCVRKAELKKTLWPVLPWIVLAMFAVWYVTPNTAETTPGTLDQIRPGWSVRYVLFPLALLDIAAVCWLARFHRHLAAAAVLLAVAFTTLREYKASLQIDPGVVGFVFPLVAAAALALLALTFSRRRAVVAAVVVALAVYGVTATQGEARIARVWDARFDVALQLSGAPDGAILAVPQLEAARRAATIAMPPLAVMGPRLERYAVSDQNGLALSAWWKEVEVERPDVIVARDLPHTNAESEAERFLHRLGRYRIAERTDHVRIYVPR
jgi:hypothetical protein